MLNYPHIRYIAPMADLPFIFSTDIIKADTDTFWGDNNVTEGLVEKRVLVLTLPFTDNSQEHIQLNKILEACKLTAEEVNKIQVAENQNIALSKLKLNLNPEVVIIFGIAPAKLGLSAMFRLNSPNNFSDIVLIPTSDLAELEQQQQTKKDLWVNALKPLFIDK